MCVCVCVPCVRACVLCVCVLCVLCVCVLCVLCVPVLAGERHGRTGHRDPDQGAEGDVTGDFNHHLHTTTELFDQFITLCRSQDSMR